MVRTEIVGSNLIVEMTGWDVFLSCKKRIETPLSQIMSVKADPNPHFPKGKMVWRMGGAYLPGVITSGSYLCDGKWYFWNVRNLKSAVVIDLQGQKYSEMVLQVPDPKSFVQEINSHIAPKSSAV